MTVLPRKGLLSVGKDGGDNTLTITAHRKGGGFPNIDWGKHPGLGEGIIPFWGPLRDTIADIQDHDYLMATLDGLSMVGDLDPAVGIGRTLAWELGERYARGGVKKGVKKALSFTYDASRKRMLRLDKDGKIFLQPGLEGHHWVIPRNGWGKSVPDFIKNRRWNISPLDPLTHKRLHSRAGDLPRFNPAQRIWHGAPAGVKRGTVGLLGQVGVSAASTAEASGHGSR